MTPSQKIRDFFTLERIVKYDLNKIESLAGVETGMIETIIKEDVNDELTNSYANSLLKVSDNIIRDEKSLDRLTVLNHVLKSKLP